MVEEAEEKVEEVEVEEAVPHIQHHYQLMCHRMLLQLEREDLHQQRKVILD